MTHQRRPNEPSTVALVTLTPREREVLTLLALGLKDKQIAAILRINCRTVQFHLLNIYAKLRARNRTQAAMLAIAHNIVSKT